MRADVDHGLVPETEVEIGDGDDVAVLQHASGLGIFLRQRGPVDLRPVPAAHVLDPARVVGMVFQRGVELGDQAVVQDDVAVAGRAHLGAGFCQQIELAAVLARQLFQLVVLFRLLLFARFDGLFDVELAVADAVDVAGSQAPFLDLAPHVVDAVAALQVLDEAFLPLEEELRVDAAGAAVLLRDPPGALFAAADGDLAVQLAGIGLADDGSVEFKPDDQG